MDVLPEVNPDESPLAPRGTLPCTIFGEEPLGSKNKSIRGCSDTQKDRKGDIHHFFSGILRFYLLGVVKKNIGEKEPKGNEENGLQTTSFQTQDHTAPPDPCPGTKHTTRNTTTNLSPTHLKETGMSRNWFQSQERLTFRKPFQV